jgi:ABC-type polysaccharide/polyol phosphate transport system ATPase subunit
MSAPPLAAHGLRKAFVIPSVRRDTVREHAFALFRPRRCERLVVLDGVDLAVGRGETLGVMGRNGSGKSTLLKLLAGIYRPDEGEVVRRAGLTAILELGLGWNPQLDAVDNIHLVGTVLGLSLREARAAVDPILEFAELERFAGLELQHYSSGMAARLAYAVAFHAVREVLLLDEIFAVGDAGFRQRCEARYRELARAGPAVVRVSHDPRIVGTFCDRALLLENGRVAFTGSGAAVSARYRQLLVGTTPESAP